MIIIRPTRGFCVCSGVFVVVVVVTWEFEAESKLTAFFTSWRKEEGEKGRMGTEGRSFLFILVVVVVVILM